MGGQVRCRCMRNSSQGSRPAARDHPSRCHPTSFALMPAIRFSLLAFQPLGLLLPPHLLRDLATIQSAWRPPYNLPGGQAEEGDGHFVPRPMWQQCLDPTCCLYAVSVTHGVLPACLLWPPCCLLSRLPTRTAMQLHACLVVVTPPTATITSRPDPFLVPATRTCPVCRRGQESAGQ